MTAPSISVVIPSYNRAHTLRRCLDSVASQSFSPLEIIVVDDLSTDATVDLLSEYSSELVRCIVLERNSGAQAARNRGIREARGDWIAFLDSDDEWLPGKLAKQVKVLENVGFDPWTVVHTAGVRVNRMTGRSTRIVLPVITGNDAYRLLLETSGPMFQGMIVSRLALGKIGGLDEEVPAYQEWDTSIRLAQYCQFVYLEEPLFVYYQHEGPTISQNASRDIEGYQHILDKFHAEIIRACGDRAWNRHVRSQVLRALNSRLWASSDRYFALMSRRDMRYRVLRVCRRLHIRPRHLSRIYGLYLSARLR